jgi:hypothetical protein
MAMTEKTIESAIVSSTSNDEIQLASVRDGLKRSRELYRKYATNDMTSDDFLLARREEAEREEQRNLNPDETK